VIFAEAPALISAIRFHRGHGMAHQTIVTIANLCQAVVMPICLSAYIPQWITLLRNRSSSDISLKAELLWAGGSLLSVFYALVQVLEFDTGYALLFTSLVNLLCLAATISLICYYRSGSSTLLAPIERAIAFNRTTSESLRLELPHPSAPVPTPPAATSEMRSPWGADSGYEANHLMQARER
jgi:hypothetical protein